MSPLTVRFVDQMLNLTKNGIELHRTHSVVGIKPVWIFSQIFIQSLKLTKILTCLIYRVYPILSIVFLPSKKKHCSWCFSPIHNTGGSRLSWIFWEHENLSSLSIIRLIQLL